MLMAQVSIGVQAALVALILGGASGCPDVCVIACPRWAAIRERILNKMSVSVS